MFLFLTLTSFKCMNRVQNFDPGSDYPEFIGKGRPAIIRSTVFGFPFSSLKANWDYATKLFPHVNFLEINCARAERHLQDAIEAKIYQLNNMTQISDKPSQYVDRVMFDRKNNESDYIYTSILNVYFNYASYDIDVFSEEIDL